MNSPPDLNQETIIDSHAHIGRWHDYFITESDSARGMAEIMDVIGIDSAAVSGFAALSGNVSYGNDLVAKAMDDFPGRFFGFAAVNPNYSEALLSELERCHSLGFVGIKLHADSNFEDWLGVKAVSEKLYPVYEFANENSLLILAHTFGTAEHLRKIAERFPTAVFIIGHGCEIWWSGRVGWENVAKEMPNVYISLTTTFRPGHIEMMVREIGADKLLYGSDMTYLDPGFQLGSVVFADIEPEEKRKILGLNFQKLLEH